MSASFKAPVALGFILAIPLFALPAHGAPLTKRDTSRRSIASRISPTREPMSSPATPVAQAPETDGLSRKDEECNFGCIDH